MRRRKPRIDNTCVCIRYIASAPRNVGAKKTIRIPIRSSDEDVVRVVPVARSAQAAAG
ncbi:MAG: hypothetical protein ACOCZU_03960 [Planctomycetota bacterium]